MNNFKGKYAHADPQGLTGPPSEDTPKQAQQFIKAIVKMEEKIKNEIYKPSCLRGKICSCENRTHRRICNRFEQDPAKITNPHDCRYHIPITNGCNYPWKQLWCADLEGIETVNKDLKGLNVQQLWQTLTRLELTYNSMKNKYPIINKG